MKKKLLAMLLALCMVLTLAPTAAADGNAAAALYYMKNEDGSGPTLMTGQGLDGTFQSAWKKYYANRDKKGSSKRDPGFLWGADVRFDCDEGETANIPEGAYSIDRKFSIYLDMGTEAAELNIGGAFSVIDGGSLKIQSSAKTVLTSQKKGALTVNISEPITVSGGTLDLCFDPITVSRGVCDAYNFTGDAAIVAESGEVTIDSNLSITGEGTPLQISGAAVVLQNLYASEGHINSTITSESAPAISVQSGSLEINGADISSNGAALEIGAGADVNMLNGNIETGDSIEIPSGARVSLSGGDISTEGSDPAVKVLSGASVTLGADISSGGDAAVTFEENAAFTMAGRTLTVAAGENYVDNNGVAVLAAGAETGGETLNAALVLADGTIVEGSDTAAPSYVMVNGAPEVTVPAGGKVTDADGNVTELPNGGKVVDGEVEPTPTWTLTFKYGDGRPDEVRNVVRGASTTLPTPTRSGYAFLGWSDGTSTYAAGAVITLTSDLTFTAVWVQHPDTEYVPEPEEPDTPVFPFYDVSTSAWYYSAVKYVYDNKLMDGVDTYVFAPKDTLTRAMVWAIIARMSGVDTTGGATWYAKAQEWVIANGISDGENATAAITRQELVTMLYRYAQIKGYDVSVGENTNILSYVDATSISEYAMSAFQWACGSGLTEGDENGALTPLATATRAQAAAIFMRFCEGVK